MSGIQFYVCRSGQCQCIDTDFIHTVLTPQTYPCTHVLKSLVIFFQLTSARPPRPESKSLFKGRPSSGNVKPKLQLQMSLPASIAGANISSSSAAAATVTELGQNGCSAVSVSGSKAFYQSSSESLSMSPAHRSLVAKQLSRSQSFKETDAEPLTVSLAFKNSLTRGQSVDAAG